MREIRAATLDELGLLAEKLELVPSANFNGVVLVVDEVPRIVVGYDNWTEGSCTMHQWIDSPRYVGRDILHAAFDYPFRQCGRNVVIGVVRSDNPKALAMDKRLGFLTAAVIPDAYGPGVDMHILQLPRNLNKW